VGITLLVKKVLKDWSAKAPVVTIDATVAAVAGSPAKGPPGKLTGPPGRPIGPPPGSIEMGPLGRAMVPPGRTEMGPPGRPMFPSGRTEMGPPGIVVGAIGIPTVPPEGPATGPPGTAMGALGRPAGGGVLEVRAGAVVAGAAGAVTLIPGMSNINIFLQTFIQWSQVNSN